MNTTIISTGKIKKQYTIDWENDLIKRLSPYTKINFVNIKGTPLTKNKDITVIKDEDSNLIISKIPENSFVISLDSNGSKIDSINFAKKVLQLQNNTSHIVFIIGGPVGLSKKIIERSNLCISFSDFTFTHQLMRVILLEQLFRAFCIINNRPYHL